MRGPLILGGVGVKRGIWAMFAGYCLLASTVWVIAPAPSKVRGVVYAAVGLGAVVWNGRRRWGAARDLGRMAVWSVLVVGVPEVLTGVGGAACSEHCGEYGAGVDSDAGGAGCGAGE